LDVGLYATVAVLAIVARGCNAEQDQVEEGRPGFIYGKLTLHTQVYDGYDIQNIGVKSN